MADDEFPVRRSCGVMQVHERLAEQIPEYRARIASIEDRTRSRVASGMLRMAMDNITIPVVVHVVFNSPAQNISDEQIKSQIDALNRDYGGKNTDKAGIPDVWKGLFSGPGIKFALATKDINGNPTSGITRTRTDTAGFTTNDKVKAAATGGVDPWPAERFLNIWVCPLSGGLLGYAQFPAGPPETDGVVILHSAFGTTGTARAPFNAGRTATHEVGHYLNLRHIWGDTEDCSGSDMVDDTPGQQLPNYGTPAFPHISCSNGPNGDMFMDYMDYVDDAAMFMFTPGQVARMHATLEGPRSLLVSDSSELVA
jgi:hypothetical protein